MPERINFTKAALESLKPPSPKKRRYVHDLKVPDLLIMVTPAGTKSFQVRKNVDGKAARITLGRFPGLTIAQARSKALAELSLIANQGTTSNQIRAEQKKQSGITLQRVFQDYVRSRKNLKPATIRDYERAVRVGFPDWLEKPLDHITRKMVEQRHQQRSAQSAARANIEMRVLRALFNYAMGEYRDKHDKLLFTENPVMQLSHNKAWNKVERKKTLIKPGDLPAWFSAVDTLPAWYGGQLAERVRVYLLLCLFNGYRRTECATLLWEDVDLDAKTLTLHDTKNSQSHTLPLTDYTRQLLVDWRTRSGTDSGLVFRATDEYSQLSNDSVDGVVDAIREKAGFHWEMHDLRRTFTTTAEGLGIIGYTLKRLINHKTGAADVTGGYIVTDIESLRGLMQAITDKLLATAK